MRSNRNNFGRASCSYYLCVLWEEKKMIYIKYELLEGHDNLQKAWLDKHRCDICGNVKLKRHEVGVLNVCSRCLKRRKSLYGQ